MKRRRLSAGRINASSSASTSDGSQFLYTTLDGQRASSETSEAVLKKYVQGLLPSNVDVDTVYRSKLHKKALMLDNPVAGLGDFGLNTAAEHKDRTAKMKKRKVMKSKEQRAKKVFAIEKDKQRYDLYLPLHELWKQYMSELLSAEVNATNFQAKLLKADLHGCIMRVIRSKCPSYLGMEGILAQETEHTFQLITKKNQLKVIPKANNVFSFVVEERVVTLYGNHFLYRSSERSARKFKNKTTIAL